MGGRKPGQALSGRPAETSPGASRISGDRGLGLAFEKGLDRGRVHTRVRGDEDDRVGQGIGAAARRASNDSQGKAAPHDRRPGPVPEDRQDRAQRSHAAAEPGAAAPPQSPQGTSQAAHDYDSTPVETGRPVSTSR